MYQIGWVFNSEKHRQDIETIISLTQDQEHWTNWA